MLHIMTKGKLVRITSDTWKKLEQERIGFETPDQCINRLCTRPGITVETIPDDEDEKKPTITIIDA